MLSCHILSSCYPFENIRKLETAKEEQGGGGRGRLWKEWPSFPDYLWESDCEKG